MYGRYLISSFILPLGFLPRWGVARDSGGRESGYDSDTHLRIPTGASSPGDSVGAGANNSDPDLMDMTERTARTELGGPSVERNTLSPD